MDRVPEIGFPGTQIHPKNVLFKASWTRLFFIFGQIFGLFDDSSKFRSAFSALHFEKSSNMAKIWPKMKKSLVQLALNPFFGCWFRVPKNRISGNTHEYYFSIHAASAIEFNSTKMKWHTKRLFLPWNEVNPVHIN